MPVAIGQQRAISAAFFNPQSRAPEPDYLRKLQSFLLHHAHGHNLLQHVTELGTVWPVFAAARTEVRDLPNAEHYVNLLVDWARNGSSTPISEAKTGVIALPLLLILQIGQYFAFLESRDLSHAQFLDQVRGVGGIQGCCGGEPAALSIACATDEAQIVENTAIFLRIVLGVGLYFEALDDWTTSEPTIVAIRLKHAEQMDELLQRFPGTYVSAIIEPRSLSFVGSAATIAQLHDHAQRSGLPADKIDISGKAHNPENSVIVPEFLQILDQNPSLFRLAPRSRLQAVVRSNRSGEKLQDDDFMEDMITMMLAACCDWCRLLGNVADDMSNSKRPSHDIVIFGLNDSVPVSPFNINRLSLHKVMAQSLSMETPPKKIEHATERNEFPASAIAIVGASCRLPGANSLAELWNLISSGVDTHEEVLTGRIDLAKSLRASQDTSMGQKKFFANFISGVEMFDNAFFSIGNKEAASMDPQQRLLLELSYEAFESSGILSSQIQGASVGCFIGNSINEYLENTASHSPTAYSATGTLRAFLCGRLSHHYNWMAPSEVIDTACSSSLVAVSRACQAIQSGECAMAIAGGVNILSGVNHFLDLGKAGFLSPRGQCKPFDAAADGYCRADGAGLIILKRLSDSIRAGDQILGVIPGIATNQGGPSPLLTVPSYHALIALYESILNQADLQPSQISYIEAHGTGTQAGDPVEMESIRSVFGSSSRSTPLSVGSIKGNIGHCEAAAGIAGLLKVLAMIKYGKIPPQASHKSLNPKIPRLEPDGMEISRKLGDWDVPLRAAVVNSYGAAGSNCALVCCEIASRRTTSPPSSHSSNIRTSLPVILSAHSRTSLFNNARALGTYLTNFPPHTTMADLAYTLNERRDRHRVCLEFTSVDSSALRSDSAPTFEYSMQSKPVVMVLSGQHDSTVALPHSIYDEYPAFRGYINACDSQLVELGYQTIKETIFQEASIPSATSLQCSIFAVQYACASCWMDSGLRPAAIVGHSLGELVALALSGTLSLKECLSLVAGRAKLIDNHWGTEKGAMLVLYSDSVNVQRLASHLRSTYGGCLLEIACHNGPKSTVAVGTVGTIELAIHALSTDVEFAGMKYKRLSTTHAFHSELTESIIPGLEKISQNLIWKAASIPIETCTPGVECLSYGKKWNPARHAREPVFFSEAVQRVEKRLGPCIWLETGLNSSIVALTRGACLNPSSHYFQPMTTESGNSKMDCVGDVVASLWRHGISLSHWAFLEAQKHQFKQLWLPPYRFDAHPHWIEIVDRAAEAHEKLSAIALSLHRSGERALPSMLIIKKDSSISNSGVSRFLVNTKCHRFQELVSGHAVLEQPLCPAPLYMECTTMAVQSIIESIHSQHLAFEDLEFHSPLGLNTSREVEILVETEVSEHTWRFTFRSSLPASEIGSILHCKGRISCSRGLSSNANARLVSGAVERLHDCRDAERLMKTRVYGLFIKVMHYAPYFKGISSLTLHESEGVAIIKLPSDQPGQDESTAWRRCDTAFVDACMSVVGLLLNSSEVVGEDETCIATGIERVDLSTACQIDSSTEWLVYVKYSLEEDAQMIGDVFVCSLKREVVAMMSGVRFAKTKITKLTKILQSANAFISPHSQEASSYRMKDMRPTDMAGNIPENQVVSAPSMDNMRSKLQEMISGYTGLAIDDIPSDDLLIQLGLDSLSMIEFTADILSDFKMEITTLEFAELTLEGLISQLARSVPNASCTHVEVLEEGVGRTRDIDTNLSSALSDVENEFTSATASSTRPIRSSGTIEQKGSSLLESCVSVDPIEGLARADEHFEAAATKRGFLHYHSNVAPIQDNLTVAYILEAFESFNVKLSSLSPEAKVPVIPHVSKHDKLVARLWDILSSRGIIEKSDTNMIRSRASSNVASSEELYRHFTTRFPMYVPEAALMKLAGQNLAACLRGEQDPLKLFFGTSQSNQIMESYYSTSPMLSTLTDQLVSYVEILIQSWIGHSTDVLQILEVGAGTGGTTSRLAENLQRHGIPIQYVFSDVSNRMIAKAKEKFKKYQWMSFEIFDLENEAPDELRDRFDIVIGTNCVHATTNKVASCRRIWDTLSEQGVAILSEGTKALPWFDLCFGLLDGWWLAEDGSHPIKSASEWMEILHAAGFQSTGFSKGLLPEASTQQLLVGWKKQAIASSHPDLTPDTAETRLDEKYRLETIVYKEVNGLKIHADIYVPRLARSSATPIALMIHGGGYVTLSRKAIRPAQTKYLISQGFLPVSIDYRLCPEVTMIDGPLSDVKSGYWWARSELPSKMLEEHGVLVDGNKIVAIGWSTGGHLAMSLAWTTRETGMPPPNAILSFYAPIDFQNQALDTHFKKTAPFARSNEGDLLHQFLGSPISHYGLDDSHGASYFGLRPGDPRSDLLLSTSRAGSALPLFLNGISNDYALSNSSSCDSSCPTFSSFIDPSCLFAIDPLAQLHAGNIHTPIFIIHSRVDDVAPFEAAEKFVRELGRREAKVSGDGNEDKQRVQSDLLALNVPHLHDVTLRPRTAGWEECVQPGYDFLSRFV